MSLLSECLVMAKPAGPSCNMRCGYCYYLGKGALFAGGSWRMAEDLLERYIVQRLAASRGPTTHFEWHGGEPTLLGLDYFRFIARMQKDRRPPGRFVSNGIQTNGLLLDEAWASFLKREGFSVGLSIDGPADVHDAFRRTASGGTTHAQRLPPSVCSNSTASFATHSACFMREMWRSLTGCTISSGGLA